ncbi:MAG: hypothetical protein JNL64_08000 [Blastocatellia bacterium]|nr:hypothetical protein [Blastocatellia bacterium]
MTKVAIQGIRGSYSSVAALKAFGEELELIECASFEGVFQAMSSGLATHAVLPVRNSTVGKIGATNRLIANHKPKALGEVEVRVDHVLATMPGTKFEDLNSVRSHSEAFRQCAIFLNSNPHLRTIIGFDTASCIRSVVHDEITGQAAICSREAAEIYGGVILRDQIADSRDNKTTFSILSSVPKPRSYRRVTQR